MKFTRLAIITAVLSITFSTAFANSPTPSPCPSPNDLATAYKTYTNDQPVSFTKNGKTITLTPRWQGWISYDANGAPTYTESASSQTPLDNRCGDQTKNCFVDTGYLNIPSADNINGPTFSAGGKNTPGFCNYRINYPNGSNDLDLFFPKK